MHTCKQAVENKWLIWITSFHLILSGFSYSTFALSEIRVSASTTGKRLLVKGEDGQLKPFQTNQYPLSQFVREYSEITKTPIQTEGSFDADLKGTVVLHLLKPISLEALTEIFHQVLGDNGYGVVDAPNRVGFIIQRLRDIRDSTTPIYDSTSLPNTYRLVTVFHTLKHINAEHATRVARNFLPAYSRILPMSEKKIAITDKGKNIEKVLKVFSAIDTEEAGKSLRKLASTSPTDSQCEDTKEIKIEKITVDNLEVTNSNFTTSSQIAPSQKGGKK